MTVCIAAICDGAFIFGASDRMLTSGDIQFEPSERKIHPITNSIACLTSGDSAFQAEILQSVLPEIVDMIANATKWLPVREVVDVYTKQRRLIKLKRAEAALLTPLGLDRHTFIDKQKLMDENIVKEITTEMINYDVPVVSTIVAGIDENGPHIYSIIDDDVSCDTKIGFACIGIGARHAESQFMLAGHGPSSGYADTLLLTYSAKRRAEVSPGVGAATDMFTIGPQPGSYINIGGEASNNLNLAYRKMRAGENRAQVKARNEINRYVDELRERAERQHQEQEGGKAS